MCHDDYRVFSFIFSRPMPFFAKRKKALKVLEIDGFWELCILGCGTCNVWTAKTAHSVTPVTRTPVTTLCTCSFRILIVMTSLFVAQCVDIAYRNTLFVGRCPQSCTNKLSESTTWPYSDFMTRFKRQNEIRKWLVNEAYYYIV